MVSRRRTNLVDTQRDIRSSDPMSNGPGANSCPGTPPTSGMPMAHSPTSQQSYTTVPSPIAQQPIYPSVPPPRPVSPFAIPTGPVTNPSPFSSMPSNRPLLQPQTRSANAMRNIRGAIKVPRNASGSNTPPTVPQSWPPPPPPRHTAFTTHPSTPSEPMSEQAFYHEIQSNFSPPRTPKRQCTESEPVTPERRRELLQRQAVKEEVTG